MTATFLQPPIDTCQTHLLDHKWLLALDRRVANQWKDQVNLAGISTVNLHSETLQSAVIGNLDIICRAIGNEASQCKKDAGPQSPMGNS